MLEADLAATPLLELRVAVENRPGTVAEIALALGRRGRQHRGHVALPGRRPAHRRDLAVDRRRGRGGSARPRSSPARPHGRADPASGVLSARRAADQLRALRSAARRRCRRRRTSRSPTAPRCSAAFGEGADADLALPRLRRTRGARWRRSRRSAPRSTSSRRRDGGARRRDRGLRPARRRRSRPAPIDVGNAGTLIRLLSRAARRPGGPLASSSTATSRSAAGRWSGSPSRWRRMGASVESGRGRRAAARDRRHRAARRRLPAPGRLRPGEVLPAPRRACSPTARRRSASPPQTRDHTERMLARLRASTVASRARSARSRRVPPRRRSRVEPADAHRAARR